MGRPDTTRNLSELLEKHIDPNNDPRVYWASEVTFDYATDHSVRVDYMRFKPVNNTVSGIEKGDFYCYEIKSSVEDFHSPNGHNFLGDFNYYVMDKDVYAIVKSEIPYEVGVLIPKQQHCWVDLVHIKNAKRKDRSRPTVEILLMMYRSARREVVKMRKKAATRGEEHETDAGKS